jgi:hypothetical protein
VFGNSRQRTLKRYLADFERPRVLLAGKGDDPSYDGVVHEVLSDCIVLIRARVEQRAGGTFTWEPLDGTVAVDRGKILHVQILNGNPA